MRWALLLVTCIFSGAACGSAATTSATRSASVSPRPSASTQAASAASGSAAPSTPTTDLTPAPSDVPETDALAPGRAAITVVDGVRVRSAPSVHDAESRKYTPLLPRGTVLFVLDGPTAASGYEWWQVVPTAFRVGGPGHGWVAGASRESEPWVQPTQIDCPPTPADLGALKKLTDGMALACFARKPITVRARLVSCNCDIDGPPVDPAWFGISAEPILLVDPNETRPPSSPEEWYQLRVDPGAGVTSLPEGHVVDITGSFDHPAAVDCLVTDFDAPPTPSPTCRFVFAATALEVVEP